LKKKEKDKKEKKNKKRKIKVVIASTFFCFSFKNFLKEKIFSNQNKIFFDIY
jgi:hypothetical protein